MLECLIIGDSIAQGAAAALRAALFDRCAIVAEQGISSSRVARIIPAEAFNTAAISAGSNDADSPALPDRLAQLRAGVSARYVLWIMPYHRRAAQIVRATAARYGDNVIDLAELPTRDHLHPASYQGLGVALARGGYAGQPRYSSASARAAPNPASAANPSPNVFRR
ncbi:hypothetical protein GCM10011404_33390 [Sphingomonas prati]|nr:hypothetical protein GCM10011404_33390 [Sphingomonas prati]